MSHLPLQDKLIAQLVEAMASRRFSPNYSTGFYWNEQVLATAKQLLATANASFSALLRRVIKNAEWSAAHYQKQLALLQQLQARQPAVATRKDLAVVFERGRGARAPVTVMIEGQAERQEEEVRTEMVRRMAARQGGWGSPLGSHPVMKARSRIEPPRQELQFRLTPPKDLVLRLEAELDVAEKSRDGRGLTIEGVDEDMIKAFWALYPENERSGKSTWIAPFEQGLFGISGCLRVRILGGESNSMGNGRLGSV
jgi:hypothetical protein